MLGKVLGRSPPRPAVRGELFVVRVRSKALYDLLRKPIDIDGIRRFVEHSEDCARSFLRGFFDSEEYADRGDGDIICYNSDRRLLKYIQKLLHGLGDRRRRAHIYKERKEPPSLTRRGGRHT